VVDDGLAETFDGNVLNSVMRRLLKDPRGDVSENYSEVDASPSWTMVIEALGALRRYSEVRLRRVGCSHDIYDHFLRGRLPAVRKHINLLLSVTGVNTKLAVILFQRRLGLYPISSVILKRATYRFFVFFCKKIQRGEG